MKRSKSIYLTAGALILSLALYGTASFADSRDSGRRGDLLRERIDLMKERMERRGDMMMRRNFSEDIILRNSANTQDVGRVRIESQLKADRGQDVSLRFRLSNVSVASGRVLEGWLVDNETGYKLSLGMFTLLGNRQADLAFRQTMVNFGTYDKVMVTEESANDTNPNPGTIVVAQADLPSSISEISFRTVLLGRNEVPATTSTARGTGKFVLNTKNNTLKFDIEVMNLSSQETGAHIHGPANPGANAAILFALPSGSSKTGTWTYDQALEDKILSGQTYVNVHSANFPNGEIRGQIIP